MLRFLCSPDEAPEGGRRKMRDDMQVGLQEEEEETWPKNAENSNLKRALALNMA